MFCLLESFVFQILTNFSVTKVKSLPGKVRESVQDYLNENLVEWSIIENVFHTLTSKVNVVNIWKEHFSAFCWFLSDEFETLFWKSEGKHSKLFQSNFSRKKLLKKWFRSYLELKRNIVSLWKGHFTVFCKFLRDEVEITFRESEAKRPKLFK